jgi:hypothetical protein
VASSIPVVAFFAECHDPVAALLQGQAVRRTAVAAQRVSVIAELAGLDEAVAAATGQTHPIEALAVGNTRRLTCSELHLSAAC